MAKRRGRQAQLNIWLLLLLLLSGCGQLQPGRSEPAEIRVGLIIPLTGELSESYAKPILEGANLAVNEVNAAGGLEVSGQRHKIVLLTEDDQDNAQTAVEVANKLINQDNVVALLGVPLSRIAIPVSEVAEAAHIPMISVKSTNPATTAGKRYVFRIPFIDPFQGRMMASFVAEELKARKAAVLFDVASAYNKELAAVFKEAFEEGGGEVVAFESYTTDANDDFTEQLTRIRDSGAEVLFLPNYSNEVIIQVQQARELGIEATFIGSDSWKPREFAPYPEFEGAFFSQLWAPEVVTEKTDGFMTLYQAQGGTMPHEYTVVTYDAFQLLFQAIQNQGKSDPESIREGLATIGTYVGVSGEMKFEGSGDPLRSGVILQMREGQATFHKVVNP